jgi:gas vesicle protein
MIFYQKSCGRNGSGENLLLTSKFYFMASKLLAGFALGVLAGILMAPDKGSETRKKIGKTGADLKNKFNDFVDSIHEKFNSVKNEAEEYAEEATQKARSYSTSNDAGKSWAG